MNNEDYTMPEIYVKEEPTTLIEILNDFYAKYDKQRLTNNGDNDIVAAVSALGYDAYMTAVEAMKLADSSDPAEIIKALRNVNYKGVTGAIAFDENGTAVKDIAYIKMADTNSVNYIFVTTTTIKQ